MERIKAWVSEHPYLTGAFVIGAIVLILIVRSRSSASTSPAVSPNPGGVSDAVYAAQLAANTQQAGVAAASQAQQGQTAAQVALGMAQLQVQEDQTAAARDVALQQTLTGGQTAQYSAQAQLAAAQAADAAAVANTATQASAAISIAGIQQQGEIQVANIGASRDISVAGIQADVSKTNIAAQLAGLENTNATSVNLGKLSLAGLENTNAATLAATVNTNETAATINQQNQTTQQLGITTQGQVDLATIAAQQDVLNNQINMAGAIAGGELQYQQNVLDTTKTLVASGTFNKGGEGGINQVTAFLGGVGSPAASTSAAAGGNVGTTEAGPGSLAGVIGAIGGAIGQVAGGLVGISKAPAALVPSVSSTFKPTATVSA
jgi:hypothetical protein